MPPTTPPPPSPETPPAAPQPQPTARGCLLPLATLLLLASCGLNTVFLLGYAGVIRDPLSNAPEAVEERVYLGDKEARDKVAVVRVNGVLTEGGIKFPVQQLRAAAADPRVKAVVLRIDSPGGSVSASEELYQCVINVRDNTGRRFPGTAPKPVYVSMGSLAASGGYYIATAGSPIVAEKLTLTGSIGVFAALPNVADWAKEHGIKLELVKAGGIKASGSFFHKLAPEERQTWQDAVDNAYDEFLAVIAKGRPGLTPDVLRTEKVVDRMIPKRDDKGNVDLDKSGKPIEVKYTRVRADGGTFTAKQALEFKLIDGIEDLPAAVRSAASRAGLSSFQAVVYEKPQTLLESLTGFNAAKAGGFPPADVSGNLTPRLWYLAPTADAGLLAPNP